MSEKILMAHGAGGQRDVASCGCAVQRCDDLKLVATFNF